MTDSCYKGAKTCYFDRSEGVLTAVGKDGAYVLKKSGQAKVDALLPLARGGSSSVNAEGK